jgi:hypothetical protein
MKDWDKELEREVEAYKSWKERSGGFSRDMTLRDQIAISAMQGFLSAPDTGWAEEEMAEQAYKMADRMLEARK